MRIKITPKGLIYFQIIFSMLYKILELVGLGVEKLNYVLHFVALYLLCLILRDKDRKIGKYVKFESTIIWILLATTVIGIFVVPLCYPDILRHMSIGVYLKGILNFYRFYIFFFATIKYLDSDDVSNIFGIVDKIFIINVVLSFYEYFILGCEQDFLGGIFGISYGGNVGLNILLCFFAAWYALKYLNKNIKLYTFLSVEIVSILIATMAELKIYYIEIIVIMIIAALLVRPNRNTIKIILASVAILTIGFYALSIIFPKQLAILMDSDKFSKYAGGSYVTGSLGRMTMFQELEEIFFQDYPLVRLFGFGIGTFDGTSNSYWATTYSYLRAGWFGNSYILLNLGYVGLIAVYMFYINSAWKAFKWRKKAGKDKIYMDFTIIMVVIILVSMWYNQTIATGTVGYLLNLVLSIPLILHKEKIQNNILLNKENI